MRKPSSHRTMINCSKRSSMYWQMSDCSGVGIGFGDQRAAYSWPYNPLMVQLNTNLSRPRRCKDIQFCQWPALNKFYFSRWNSTKCHLNRLGHLNQDHIRLKVGELYCNPIERILIPCESLTKGNYCWDKYTDNDLCIKSIHFLKLLRSALTIAFSINTKWKHTFRLGYQWKCKSNLDYHALMT